MCVPLEISVDQYLTGKFAIACWHCNGAAVRDRPRPVHARLVGPQNEEPIAPVNQYKLIFAKSSSFVNTDSKSPPQSDHARNFSMIHAARPAGESMSANARVCGRVPIVPSTPCANLLCPAARQL
jgi:hypothetical protein